MENRHRLRVLITIVALSAYHAVAAQSSQVTVETGTLAGSVDGGVESWKGIPYAAPPIGVLRWRAPQPAAGWKGVRQEGARHATDIPFFFDTIDVPYQGKTTPRDHGMSKAISTYLVNFVRRGDPNSGPLPVWPRYSRATDVIANFAEDGTVIPHKDPWGPELDAASSSRPVR